MTTSDSNNIITEVKNSLDALKSRMEMTGKGVSESEDSSIEVIQSEKKGKNLKTKRTEMEE